MSDEMNFGGGIGDLIFQHIPKPVVRGILNGNPRGRITHIDDPIVLFSQSPLDAFHRKRRAAEAVQEDDVIGGGGCVGLQKHRHHGGDQEASHLFSSMRRVDDNAEKAGIEKGNRNIEESDGEINEPYPQTENQNS